MTEFMVPEWLVGMLPALAYVLNEVVFKYAGELSGDQKQNIVAVVSLGLAAALAALGGVPLPAEAPATGLVMDWLGYVLVMAGFVMGGAVMIHNGLDGLRGRVRGGGG